MNTSRTNDSSRFFKERPRVVATISSAADWRLAEKITPASPSSPDLFEVRADLLLADSAELAGDITQLPLPVLLTVRHPAEGGKGPFDPAERAAIYRRYWTNVAAIDIELAFAQPDLTNEARSNGLAVVLSAHDFSGTPSLAQLQDWTARADDLGANLFKVATTTHTPADLITLLTWLDSEKNLPLAAMGMGTLGKISRPLLAQLGSQLNYGYLDAPVVPGQWPAPELRRLIDSLIS